MQQQELQQQRQLLAGSANTKMAVVSVLITWYEIIKRVRMENMTG